MKLLDLFKHTKYVDSKGNLNVDIKSLSQNATQKCEDGLLFCYKGVEFDTHDFWQTFEQNGYVALVVERFVEDCPLPQILVKNTRKIMPKICNTFFGNPLKRLKFVGVTGTNGKTTTTNLIYNILEHAHKKVGLVGTNGAKYLNSVVPLSHTTPDTVPLFYLLFNMANAGVEFVVMEVSAHALDLGKLCGIKFDVAVFSNLTEDHLDYFGSMGKYAMAKSKFFSKRYAKFCVINTDDSYGKLFFALCNTPKTNYAIHSPAQNFAMNLLPSTTGTWFLANVFDNVFQISLPLVAEFNVFNALSAMVCAKHLGIENDYIVQALTSTPQIDGRMNFYTLSNGAQFVIDYAHTPDGLYRALSSLKPLCKGKLFCVFGCGGNRDRLKRPKMGNIACSLADFVVVTSDNPRGEPPLKIISQIVDEVKSSNYVVEPNRAEAIKKAIQMSQKNDIILCAGKGHENYQEIAGKKIHFSDKEQILPFINK